jgi:hypothetical protein
METDTAVLRRSRHFDLVLKLVSTMPEIDREPVLKAVMLFFDNKPYVEVLYEEIDG